MKMLEGLKARKTFYPPLACGHCGPFKDLEPRMALAEREPPHHLCLGTHHCPGYTALTESFSLYKLDPFKVIAIERVILLHWTEDALTLYTTSYATAACECSDVVAASSMNSYEVEAFVPQSEHSE